MFSFQRKLMFAVLPACAVAFLSFFPPGPLQSKSPVRISRGFVATDGPRFFVDGKPFRFVGANVAVIYKDEERQRLAETLSEAAFDGVKVIRVWAHGEGGEGAEMKSLGSDRDDWPRKHHFRTAPERRQWLEVHNLPNVDFADVHFYPCDALDSFVDSPQALKEFVANRAAAAYQMGKPVVMGEFGMGPEGNHNISQREWFKAFFEGCAESGIAGALYWILTPDPKRGYGVTYVTDRDEVVRQEILVGA